MNSQEVSYQFGQLGSAHVQAAGFSVKPPNGMVIVAIQFLDNLKMDIMTVDQSVPLDYTVTAGPNNKFDSFIGITNGNDGVYDDGGPTNNGRGQKIDTATEFPKGITIYGRWTEVSLSTGSDNGIICYFGT
tara:strand:+ start:168 stop:560 length:393 start_codon:yes stop_codon:yes gene_type:complete